MEVPLGTSLRDRARRSGRLRQGTLKAVLVGGPTGGFLPADALDTPLTVGGPGRGRAPWWAPARIAGRRTTATCLVELATLLTRYLSDEACGKTIPCRIGTRRLAELGDAPLQRPVPARPTPQLLGDLAARHPRRRALCGLEAGGVNPLLSGMRYFAAEFEDAHRCGLAARPASASPSRWRAQPMTTLT